MVPKAADGGISIRAPTRGATLLANSETLIEQFQSALPRGERPLPVTNQSRLTLFQSALPRGERPCITCSGVSPVNFNPRSHEGSDRREQEFFTSRKNFIPRSHEGSDEGLESSGKDLGISIRAPTRGATRKTHRYKAVVEFQSALPRGERPSSTVGGSNFFGTQGG